MIVSPPASAPSSCPYCRARIPSQWRQPDCPVCGAPLGLPGAVSSYTLSSEAQGLGERLVALNDRLVEAGARNAEDAMSLGCWLSLFLIVAAGVLAFLLSRRSLTITVIALVTVTMAAAGVVNLLSLTAKSGAARRVFRMEIQPEIHELMDIHGLDPQAFHALALDCLPDEAPLRTFLDTARA